MIVEGPLVGEAGAPIHWSPDAFPLQATVLDAIDDPRWAKVCMMTAPQAFGKTAGVVVPLLMWGIAHMGEPVIYMAGSTDDASTQYGAKIKPVIDAYDAASDVDDLVPENPDFGGKHFYRMYTNGSAMHVLGAESIGRLSGKTARIAAPDDVQAYPERLPKFGHPADYVATRTAAFPGDRTYLLYSGTAGTVGCWLWRTLSASACFCPFVPCLGCGTFQLIEFDRFVYDAEDLDAVKAGTWMRCAVAKCDHQITFADLPRMLRRHLWVSMPPDADWVLKPPEGGTTIDRKTASIYPATQRNTNVAGFWANAFYWPWGRSWGELAAEYVSRKEDPDKMLDWQQNYLVRPFEEPQVDEDAMEPQDIYALRVESHRWKTIPAAAGVHEDKGVVIVTADVQAGFIWYLVWAWNLETGSSWLVELGRFGKGGETGEFGSKGEKVRAWKSRAAQALDGLWSKEVAGWSVVGPGGEELARVNAARGGIDCGFLRETIQTWCRMRNGGRWAGKWLPIEGSQSRARGKVPMWPGIGQPTIERKTKRRYYDCNTNRAKLIVRDILMIPPGEPGSLTLPGDMPDYPREVFGKHLCSEQFDSERGVWKQIAHENHLLDAAAEQVICALSCAVKLGAMTEEGPRVVTDWFKKQREGKG